MIASISPDGPGSSGLGDVFLLHDSIPELGMEDINLQVSFLGKVMNYPIIINALTGGTEEARQINRTLAGVARKYGLAMAVGSQTIAIENPDLTGSFAIVREEYPEGIILANIGAGARPDHVLEAVKMIDADGIQLHFNVPQEMAMPEGDRSFKGVIDNITRIVDCCPVPVIAKEVGFGFSREAFLKLFQAGIRIFDIGGKGGTNFMVIEAGRNGLFADELDDWGIPTVVSLAEALSLELPVQIIASGGIRKAGDAAKTLAMGAELVGIASPFLKCLLRGGAQELNKKVADFLYRFKAIFLMSGSRDIDEIRTKPVIILGDTAQWLSARNIDLRRWTR